MVFLIILFLLYFIGMDHSSFSSYTYSSQFSVYYFSFYNVSPSCSATLLNLDTEEKDKESEKAGRLFRQGWLARSFLQTSFVKEVLVSFHNADWCCDVKKITAGDSTLTGKIYLITYLVEYVQCVGTEMKFTKVFLTHV